MTDLVKIGLNAASKVFYLGCTLGCRPPNLEAVVQAVRANKGLSISAINFFFNNRPVKNLFAMFRLIFPIPVTYYIYT